MSICTDVCSFIESKTTVVQTSNVGFTSEVSDYLVVHTGPGLAKTILQGTVQGGRRRGRQRTSKSGLALNGIPYYVKPRTARSGGSWL